MLPYPTSFPDLRAWANSAGISINEARVRFAQFAILRAIAGVPELRQGLIFKGGNALDFVWQPNRSTVDLDFSVDPDSSLARPDEPTLRRLLERSMTSASTNFGVTLAVQKVQQHPPGADKQFITYDVRVVYALPDQENLRQRLRQGETIAQGISLDISFNEPIGDTRFQEVSPGSSVRVATLEDIVAEKLRALLQQPIRNRRRRQDLLDIAVVLQSGSTLDRRLVATFLLEKAAARNVPVARGAFRHPDVVERARAGYDDLAATTRVQFIPFDDALLLLHTLVDELAIPA